MKKKRMIIITQKTGMQGKRLQLVPRRTRRFGKESVFPSGVSPPADENIEGGKQQKNAKKECKITRRKRAGDCGTTHHTQILWYRSDLGLFCQQCIYAGKRASQDVVVASAALRSRGKMGDNFNKYSSRLIVHLFDFTNNKCHDLELLHSTGQSGTQATTVYTLRSRPRDKKQRERFQTTMVSGGCRCYEIAWCCTSFDPRPIHSPPISIDFHIGGGRKERQSLHTNVME